MSTLSAKERAALPADAFCGPGKTFPILDQNDVTSAAHLIGKASNPGAVKACVIRKAKAKGWTLPAAWDAGAKKMAAFAERSFADIQALLEAALNAKNGGYRYWIQAVYPAYCIYQNSEDRTLYKRPYTLADDDTVTWGDPAAVRPAYEPISATFTLDAGGRYEDEAWAIYPNALLFRAGEYPDKAFSLTPEQMWLAVDRFTPITGNVLHTDFLKGRACEVRSVHLDEADGSILRGEVAVPLGLDTLLTAAERKLSCEWLPGADGIPLLDGVGLVLSPRIADAALMSAYAAFTGARHNGSDQRALNTAHDAIVSAGADNCPAPVKERRMSFVDKVRAWFAAGMPPEFDETAPVPPAPTPSPTPPAPSPPEPPPAFSADPALAAAQTRIAALEAEAQTTKAAFAAAAAAQRQKDAAAFATTQIGTSHRLPPHAFGLLTALLAQTLADDAAAPQVVTFAAPTDADATATGQGSRADLVRRLVECLPPAAGFSERTGVALDGTGTWAEPKSTTPTPESRDKTLAGSDLGRTILAARNGHPKNGAQ